MCILTGYPGTVVYTLQRARTVCRSCRDTVLILVAGKDALDQYLMRNPGELIDQEPEDAVVNPYNTSVLDRYTLVRGRGDANSNRRFVSLQAIGLKRIFPLF